MYEFLKDKLFLHELDNLHLKNQYVKITVLSWNEDPIQEIQGRITSGGTISINGNSSLRRTCNLSIYAEEKENDLTQIDTLFSINRKVKLELGVKNTVPNLTYDTTDEKTKIISHHIVNYVERYGEIVWFPLGIFVIFDPNLSHSTTGVSISLSLKDKMCLLNGDAGGVLPASVEFHKREWEDENGVVTIEYPTIRQIVQESVNHFGKENLSKIIISDLDERIKQCMRWTGGTPLYYVNTMLNNQNEHSYFIDYDKALAKAGGNPDKIITYEYGADVGFIMTDFIYPGELISNPGETVTSVLDKIISVLGNYEYFYDVYGNFRFQEIKNYLNITYTTQVLKDGYTENGNNNYTIDLSSGKSVYNFEGTKIVNAFSNAPKYSNIKNDFVVWGVRKSAEGVQIPIRYHLAIDTRPELKSIKNDKGQTIEAYGKHKVKFFVGEDGNTRAAALKVGESGTTVYTKDWREELYYQGVEAEDTGTDYNYYYVELINEWPKLYDLEKQEFKDYVENEPTTLDFYLDMIDTHTEVGRYSVQNIGRRSQVVSDDKINCVFESEVPDIIFINNDDTSEEMEELKQECIALGQAYVQVDSNIYDLLVIGGWQNSCYQRVCEMLYQYTNMNNSITISCLPLYYLEPNTRITVNDAASGIFGDYIIQSISLPLDISGLMSITAYKALQKI